MKLKIFASMFSISLICFGQESWAEKTSLPKIVLVPVPPVSNAKGFEQAPYSRHFSYNASSETSSAPYETDAEAVTAARGFLAANFGPTPLELKVSRILHSGSGSASPQNATDLGHTITFSTFWHGVEIHDCHAVIYIKGRSISNATVQLAKPEEVPGSTRKLVSRESAIKLWRAQVVEHFGAPKDITPKIANLVFIWSSTDNSSRDEAKQGSVCSPNWAIRVSENAEELLVDGYSGQVWRND